MSRSLGSPKDVYSLDMHTMGEKTPGFARLVKPVSRDMGNKGEEILHIYTQRLTVLFSTIIWGSFQQQKMMWMRLWLAAS